MKHDKTLDGVNHREPHHYLALFFTVGLCEHTCLKGRPHTDGAFHDYEKELTKAPNHKRSGEIIAAMKTELMSHDSFLPFHHYASLWHHIHQADLEHQKV